MDIDTKTEIVLLKAKITVLESQLSSAVEKINKLTIKLNAFIERMTYSK